MPDFAHLWLLLKEFFSNGSHQAREYPWRGKVPWTKEFKYSIKSKTVRQSIHPELRKLFEEVLHYRDHALVSGYRSETEQAEMVLLGRSQLPWPFSKHNKIPSRAVDVAPYPVPGDEDPEWDYFALFVKALAVDMDIVVKWGGDWTSFVDKWHWEHEDF